MNIDQPYRLAIEAFNESGVSKVGSGESFRPERLIGFHYGDGTASTLRMICRKMF